MTVSGTSRRARVLWAVTLAALLLSPTSILISARAQPKPPEQGYKEWLKEHTFRATVRVEVWYDGKALHLRKVLEGPELRNKLGVERLVGEEAVIDITGSELKDMAGALGLSQAEVERLASGETVEVYLGTFSETCTDGADPWYSYPPYSYPRYSWARYGSSQTGFYYCVADPINLLWEKSSGDLYPYAVETTFTGHGWGYTWFENPNYVYDPIYGWKPDEYSLKKDYPGTSYYRYHVRLWKVHKGGYGKVVTVGQAHVDTWLHNPVLYEEAEDEASDAFWGWDYAGQVYLYNAEGSPGDPEHYNDGWAPKWLYPWG